MITLPHTRLRVATTHPHVTSLQQLELSRGVAWTAVVEYAGARVGTFENAGRGGDTEFVPDDFDRYGYGHFRRFVTDSSRDGEPVDEERAMELLVEEYDIEQAVSRVAKSRVMTCARLVWEGYSLDTLTVRRPRTDAERRALAHELTRTSSGPKDGVWEIWGGAGEGWGSLLPDQPE